MKKSHFLLFFIILLLNNCNKNYQTSNIKVKLRSDQENMMELKTILLNVYSNNLTYLYNKPMIKIDDIWSIVLPKLPIDKRLTFNAVAFNIDDEFIYQAIKDITLEDKSQIIILELKYMDECNCSFFGANIDYITDYGKYVMIRFNIYNYLENRLEYKLYSENYNIFTPNNDIIDSYDNNYTYQLDVNYTKPNSQERFVNFLYLDNLDLEKKYKLEFDLMIDKNNHIKLVENRPPQILNLDIDKRYNTIKINANVVDDENSRIDYLWEVIDGELEIVGDNKMSQVLFKNYVMGVESQISIKVTDKRGFVNQEIYLID